jgi:dTDP-4-dehydrorhamnose reductase
MRILLFGASGQVGTELQRIEGQECIVPERDTYDLTEPDRQLRPNRRRDQRGSLHSG